MFSTKAAGYGRALAPSAARSGCGGGITSSLGASQEQALLRP
jgi:hypothetical protein